MTIQYRITVSNTTPTSAGLVGLQTDRIRKDNDITLSISVIIFQIRVVSDTDTDQIFNGYRIRIGYQTDTYTNTDIFLILSKILYISLKKYILFFYRIINYKN
jgi:hypothetical protein